MMMMTTDQHLEAIRKQLAEMQRQIDKLTGGGRKVPKNA